MRKRRVLIPALLIALTLALAQDMTSSPPAQLNYDVRLSIVESRLGRLELDVAGLARMPEQLARIETTLENLNEKASGNSGILETIGVGITMTLISGIVAFTMGKKAGSGGK